MSPVASELDTETAVLTFRIADEEFALPAAGVAEITRVPAWTRVPHAPPSLLGLANLRGTVLPVVSLSSLLGQPASPPSATSRVLVLAGAAPVGLLVDAVAALGMGGTSRLIEPGTLLARDFGAMQGRDAAPQQRAEPSRPEQETAARGDKLALLGMRLGDQEYGLPLDRVAEVLRLPETVAALPRTDSAMLGVVAFRSGVLPLVSLRVLLGLPARAPDRAARIVVTALGRAPVGLVVDGVTAALSIPLAAIDRVPPVLTRGGGEAEIEGIGRLEGGRRLICILAAARLFDAETSARIRAHGNQESTPMSGPETSGAVEQFVIFRLGDDQYGLPVGAVEEVVRRPDALTRLPHAPDFVEGVMNLHGRVVPLIDAGRRFGAHEAGERARRVILVTMDGLQAGFVADSVSEVMSVPAAELRPAPEFDTDATRLFDRVTIERGGRVILLVSPQGLLQQAERDLLAAFSGPRGAEAAPPT